MDNLVVTIDIKDLLVRVLKAWKKIIVGALIGALIFGAYGYYKGMNEYKVKSDFIAKTNGYVYSNFRMKDLYFVPNFENHIMTSSGDIKEEVISELDIALGKYDSYKIAIEGINRYLENGIYPNVDKLKAPKYNDMYIIKLKDGISTNYEVISNTVSKYLETQLINDSLFLEIAEKTGYVSDTIWYDTVYVNDSVLGEKDNNRPSANFTVSIVADTKENVCLIQDIVKTRMSSIIEMAKTNFFEYGVDIVLVGENYTETIEEGIVAIRNAKEEDLNNYKTAIDGISKSLSGDASSLFNGLIAVSGNINEKEYVVEKDLINVKLIAIGLVLGVFLVCLYVALKYLFQKGLRRPEDLSEIFNLPIFNVMIKDDNSLYSRTAKDIELTIKELKLKSLYLGGGNTEGLKELRKELFNLLDGKLKIEVKSDVEDNNITSMSNCETTVLFYEIDKSKYEDIYKEIELSKRMGSKVIGFIAYRG